jgi:hypothetical protein
MIETTSTDPVTPARDIPATGASPVLPAYELGATSLGTAAAETTAADTAGVENGDIETAGIEREDIEGRDTAARPARGGAPAGLDPVPPAHDGARWAVAHEPSPGAVRAAEGLLRAALHGWGIRDFTVLAAAEVAAHELAGRAVRDLRDAGRSDDLDITVRLVRRGDRRYVRVEVSHTAPGWPDESDWAARFTALALTPATFGTRRSDDYEGMWAEIDATPA